jgi:hypothetical protein
LKNENRIKFLNKTFLYRSQELSNYPDNDREENTKDDHGSDRKIKPEVLFLYPYVARQTADPMHFVVKEID